MEALIKITTTEKGDVVSARELHAYLTSDVVSDFSSWCKRMFKYDFKLDVDYSLIKFDEPTTHNKTDYALTISCAKEISMLQRSPKGKIARQYFLACENKLKDIVEFKAMPDDLLLSKAVVVAVARLDEANKTIEEQKATIKQLAPKADYVDKVLAAPETYTATQLAKMLQMSVTRFNKLLKEKQIQFKQGRHWFLRAKYQDKGYVKFKNHLYIDSKNESHTSQSMVWTKYGKVFIMNLFQQFNQPPGHYNMPRGSA